jgi:hypothetical protein
MSGPRSPSAREIVLITARISDLLLTALLQAPSYASVSQALCSSMFRQALLQKANPADTVRKLLELARVAPGARAREILYLLLRGFLTCSSPPSCRRHHQYCLDVSAQISTRTVSTRHGTLWTLGAFELDAGLSIITSYRWSVNEWPQEPERARYCTYYCEDF